ncbi:hypothetical protein B0H66DRAFT_12749 [Apodospora peruviana]|uniref:Uncharacterized protein n=1 Tax=Apodospora peruviana TaxID=516989 RepID=A0AAE0MFG1_9PEZI|nr:hypothetical protein B0H66DRAFT_12749 [Apodospora peruviana]
MAEMEIETDDDILIRVVQDGSMDYSSWPRLLPALLSRIDKTARNEFPIPRIPPPRPPVRPPSPRFLAPLPSSDVIEPPDSSDTTPSSQDTNKENANPTPSSETRSSVLNSVPSSTISHPSSAPNLVTQPEQPLEPLPPGALPAPIAALLDEITSTLTDGFSMYPPHTIQRLSELVLRPRQHYRGLVAYLHALDRVVHVTSGANIYPLPPAIPDMSAMSLLANGVGSSAAGGLTINPAIANNIGSDEALGGALLTPIPWLSSGRRNRGGSEDGSDVGSSSPLSEGSGSSQQQVPMPQQQSQSQRQVGGANGRKMEAQLRTESTETIEGPNGMGSIETVSISLNGIPSTGAGAVLANRGVTQGELLRQEQRAGVVPLSQLARQQQQQQAQGNAPPAGSAEDDEDAPMGEADPDDEIPHARGPDEIGPADIGSQGQTTSSYTIGAAGGAVDNIQAIDVEAAVGRRQSPPELPQAQRQTTSSRSPEVGDVIPRSPKREATDELDSNPSNKRVKEDEDNDVADAAAAEKEEEVKRDAEGDVMIGDTSHPTAAATASSASSLTVRDQGDPDPAGEPSKTEAGAETPTGDVPGDNPGGATKDSTATLASETGTEKAPADGEKKGAGEEPEKSADAAKESRSGASELSG